MHRSGSCGGGKVCPVVDRTKRAQTRYFSTFIDQLMGVQGTELPPSRDDALSHLASIADQQTKEPYQQRFENLRLGIQADGKGDGHWQRSKHRSFWTKSNCTCLATLCLPLTNRELNKISGYKSLKCQECVDMRIPVVPCVLAHLLTEFRVDFASITRSGRVYDVTASKQNVCQESQIRCHYSHVPQDSRGPSLPPAASYYGQSNEDIPE